MAMCSPPGDMTTDTENLEELATPPTPKTSK